MDDSILESTGMFANDYWKEVIENWRFYLKEFEKDQFRHGKCQGYYYNERASLGFFINAFVKKGETVILQEFSTPVIYEGNKTAWGRCDLFAKVNGEHIYFESKQMGLSLNNSRELLFELIDYWLKTAENQIRKYKEAESEKKVIILFITPWQTEKVWRAKNNKIYEYQGFLKENYSDVKDILISFYIPDKDHVAEYEKYFYPGVFIILKKV